MTSIYLIGHIRRVTATAFDVLAEPNRRRILDSLRAGERPVSQLVQELRLSQPSVSKHLRALREAGLVDSRRTARMVMHARTPIGDALVAAPSGSAGLEDA